jgi:hypothetical protein
MAGLQMNDEYTRTFNADPALVWLRKKKVRFQVGSLYM